MADEKLSQLPTGTPTTAALIEYVNPAVTTDGPAGTNFKAPFSAFAALVPPPTGFARLAGGNQFTGDQLFGGSTLSVYPDSSFAGTAAARVDPSGALYAGTGSFWDAVTLGATDPNGDQHAGNLTVLGSPADGTDGQFTVFAADGVSQFVVQGAGAYWMDSSSASTASVVGAAMALGGTTAVGGLTVTGPSFQQVAISGADGSIVASGQVSAPSFIGSWAGNTIPVGRGGTGQTAWTSGAMLYASGNATLASAPALAYATTGVHLTVTAAAAGVVPLAVKAAASQTADLQQWRDSSGTVLAGVTAAGTVYAKAAAGVPQVGFLAANGLAQWGVTLGSEAVPNVYIGALLTGTTQWFWRANWSDSTRASNTFMVPSGVTNVPTLAAQATAGQTADLYQCRDSSGAVIAGWTVAGYVYLPGGLRLLGRTSSAAAPTTTQLPNDKDCAIHKDTSGGSLYLAVNDGGVVKKVALT